MEDERKRRVELWQKAIRLAEGLRKKNQQAALRAMDEEQKRRVHEDGTIPSNGHEERFNKIKTELVAHEAEVKASKAQRKHSSRTILDQVMERQRELVEMWEAKEKTMEKLRYL